MKGPALIARDKFEDARGSFEMLIQKDEIMISYPEYQNLVQINLIVGKLGGLRGFHMSHPSANHWKVVTCVSGMVRDAVLDIRPSSQTFGEYAVVDMSSDSGLALIIPPGFAHAVESLTENSLTIYGTSIPYSDNKEFEINPLSGDWKHIWTENPILSQRDIEAQTWETYKFGLNDTKNEKVV